LKEEIPKGVKRVLVVYGGGSIKKNGLYDQVLGILQDMDLEIHELAGAGLVNLGLLFKPSEEISTQEDPKPTR